MTMTATVTGTGHLRVSPSLSLMSTMYALNSASHGHTTSCLVPRSEYISFSVCRHLVRFSLLIFGSKIAKSSSHSTAEHRTWNRVHFSTRLTDVTSHNCCCVMSCTRHSCQHTTSMSHTDVTSHNCCWVMMSCTWHSYQHTISMSHRQRTRSRQQASRKMRRPRHRHMYVCKHICYVRS